MRNEESKSGLTVFRLLIMLVGVFVISSVTSCDNGPPPILGMLYELYIKLNTYLYRFTKVIKITQQEESLI
nr:hypothetical protein [uncultured Desulfobacter sp.]